MQSGLRRPPCNLVTPSNGTAPLQLATRNGTSSDHSFLSGTLDEVIIFDRRLSASEISALNAQIQ